MLGFNRKALHASKLYPPNIGFDADNKMLKFVNTDYLDTPVVNCNIAGVDYEFSLDEGVKYNLPEIDKEYEVNYKLTSTLKGIKPYSGKFKIFMNDEECKYFRYDGDYYSNSIKDYLGVKSNIVIPTNHNLVPTINANIEKFKNVKASSISVTTPIYMDTFLIMDSRISLFKILTDNFTLQPRQFENITNLRTIEVSSFDRIPARAFYNCTNLKLNLNLIKKFDNFGDYSFYNTRSQKAIRCAAHTIQSGVFDYSSNPVQKVIYTSSISLNGLTNENAEGTKTGGLLYKGGKHDFVCGSNDSNWIDEPAKSSVVIHGGWDKVKNVDYRTPGKNEIQLFADPNIMAMKITQKTYEGEILKSIVDLPQPPELFNSKKLFKSNNEFDLFERVEMVPYDSSGVLTKSIKAPYGELLGQPTERIELAFSIGNTTTTSTGTERLWIGDEQVGWDTIPGRTWYHYFYSPDNVTRMCYMVKRNGEYLPGLNGEIIQDIEMEPFGFNPNYPIYKLDITKYYNFDEYISDTSGKDIIVFRDYKCGATRLGITLQNIYERAYLVKEEIKTNKEFEDWPDVFNFIPSKWRNYNELLDYGSSPVFLFFTKQDNSTLTYMGNVFETNVPALRAYFYIDERAPIVLVHVQPSTLNQYNQILYKDGITLGVKLKQTNMPNIGYFDFSLLDSSFTPADFEANDVIDPYMQYGYLKEYVETMTDDGLVFVESNALVQYMNMTRKDASLANARLNA